MQNKFQAKQDKTTQCAPDKPTVIPKIERRLSSSDIDRMPAYLLEELGGRFKEDTNYDLGEKPQLEAIKLLKKERFKMML
jgi:hypothetical protein